jgi:peptide deformylase
MVWVERACAVRVRYEDERGESITLAAAGAFSELLQHEMDHLDGVLAVDRAIDGNSLCTREEWERRYKSGGPPGLLEARSAPTLPSL